MPSCWPPPPCPGPSPTPPHPDPLSPPARYADEYSPVRLDALARSKVSIDRLEESDLDYATSVASLARLRGRLKLAVANFVGCCGEYVNYVKKVCVGGGVGGGGGWLVGVDMEGSTAAEGALWRKWDGPRKSGCFGAATAEAKVQAML